MEHGAIATLTATVCSCLEIFADYDGIRHRKNVFQTTYKRRHTSFWGISLQFGFVLFAG